MGILFVLYTGFTHITGSCSKGPRPGPHVAVCEPDIAAGIGLQCNLVHHGGANSYNETLSYVFQVKHKRNGRIQTVAKIWIN